MNRSEWITHHGFTEEDMWLVDECLKFGGIITAIYEKPLGYEIIKYNK